jgi:FMN reductase
VTRVSRNGAVAAAGAPTILGIGGTLRPNSTSERALRVALDVAATRGAHIEIITARELNLPMYDPDCAVLAEGAGHLIESVRRADGLIVSTPAYHGGASGLLKNAFDYLEALAAAPNPYLHNKAVGCIVAASGWQGGSATLTSLRSIIHALRGWPTPLGVAINSTTMPFGVDGRVADPKLGGQLEALGSQVVAFSSAQREVAEEVRQASVPRLRQ